MVVAISVIFDWRDTGPPVLGPAGELVAREGVSPTSPSTALAVLRRRCAGGAFGSFGFLVRFGFSPPSSGFMLFRLILDPGLGPGFRRGRPSLVSRGWPDTSYLMAVGSTTISSRFPAFALDLPGPVGDVGADSMDGGSDNSGEELYRVRLPDAVAISAKLCYSDTPNQQ